MRFTNRCVFLLALVVLVHSGRADTLLNLTQSTPSLTSIKPVGASYAFNGTTDIGTFTINTFVSTMGTVGDSGSPFPNTTFKVNMIFSANFLVNPVTKALTPEASTLTIRGDMDNNAATGVNGYETTLFSSSVLSAFGSGTIGSGTSGIFEFLFKSDGTGALANVLGAGIGAKLIAINPQAADPDYTTSFPIATDLTSKLDVFSTPSPMSWTGGGILFLGLFAVRQRKSCLARG